MDDLSPQQVVHKPNTAKPMESAKKNKARRVLLAVLSAVLLLCLSLWYVRNYYNVDGLIHVQSQNGVFDLTGADFDSGFFRLEGGVAYIPGILTPQEFRLRAGEAQQGNPWRLPCATSRIRVHVPEGVYTLTCASLDYASRTYVNGELRFEAGTPGETAEDFSPGYSYMTLDVRPENGVIEIVQQGANFVHRQGSGHSNLYLGRPETVRRFLALTFGPEYIIVGLFAALFLVHLVLFLVRRSYRPNLIFSLLCLTWLIRSGVTGVKVFFAMFPALPWQLAFRAEYLSLPIAAFLVVLLARQMFPGVPQKWFVSTVGAVSAIFSALCLVADTVTMSWALLPFEGFFTLSILYLCVRFVIKVPGMARAGQFKIEQTVSLAGFVVFIAAAINDALYHLDVFSYLGFQMSFTLTGLAMLIFSFFQGTVMFYGTMRESALAHQRERQAEAENQMLLEMSRLKSAFYTDMSHEMKTPLTVIAVNAQFAVQSISMGTVDDETVVDLNAISAEAMRLARMVTSLVGLGRMQDGKGGVLSLDTLIGETARVYQALFARKQNTLTLKIAPGLPPVRGDADQLAQVLINLLANANRHTSGGSICVCANTSANEETGQRSITVCVTDTGEGIAPDLLPHVFERFCRGERGDSGLGLFICREIIAAHGGSIGVESEPGKGTKIWFSVPIMVN